MLEDLIADQKAKKKKEVLKKRYGMVMTQELERRVDDMCNLSEVLIENAILDGMEKGIEKGIEKGTFNTYVSLVKDGILSKEDAAKRLNMQPEEFEEKMALSLSQEERA